MRVTRHLYDVPGWGVGEVWAREGTVIQHELASEALHREQEPASAESAAFVVLDADAGPGMLEASTASPSTDGVVPDLCRRVVSHLGGIPTSYEGIPIDLAWATPLQRDFAAVARSIPWGDVVSYGELAALAGRPGAARAAGSFCAENRFSLIIPCHRVVAASGIGGYGAAGLELKRRLLALEGVRL
jgi:methylated-DNA-[protein]-cysteine S-methyltransferase